MLSISFLQTLRAMPERTYRQISDPKTTCWLSILLLSVQPSDSQGQLPHRLYLIVLSSGDGVRGWYGYISSTFPLKSLITIIGYLVSSFFCLIYFCLSAAWRPSGSGLTWPIDQQPSLSSLILSQVLLM